MINLLVDEAFAFDFLTILCVKAEKANKQDQRRFYTQIADLSESISEQIGVDKHLEILSSEQYLNLMQANRDTFNAVAAAKDSPLEKEAWLANNSRYEFKKQLQEKFFNKPLTEKKI